jgi:hypothetical protein
VLGCVAMVVVAGVVGAGAVVVGVPPSVRVVAGSVGLVRVMVPMVPVRVPLPAPWPQPASTTADTTTMHDARSSRTDYRMPGPNPRRFIRPA